MRRRIGVLALQGSVAEHLAALSSLPDVRAVPVRAVDALRGLDGIILPGGESTTLARLLRLQGLMEPLRRRLADGLPAWGTCAGMILLAREVAGETAHLALMDIAVRRNAYGRQLGSFRTRLTLTGFVDHPVESVFIRAPWIERVWGDARVLATHKGKIVAARQGRLLVTAFHPELTPDTAVHAAFVAQCGG